MWQKQNHEKGQSIMFPSTLVKGRLGNLMVSALVPGMSGLVAGDTVLCLFSTQEYKVPANY